MEEEMEDAQDEMQQGQRRCLEQAKGGGAQSGSMRKSQRRAAAREGKRLAKQEAQRGPSKKVKEEEEEKEKGEGGQRDGSSHRHDAGEDGKGAATTEGSFHEQQFAAEGLVRLGFRFVEHDGK